MDSEGRDERFDRLLENFEKFQTNSDKLRRMKNFLIKAIEKARGDKPYWKGRKIRMRIGLVDVMYVEVDQTREDKTVTIRFFEYTHNEILEEITEGNVTLMQLEHIMMNPSPIIDAAAAYCRSMDCFRDFERQFNRFGPITFTQ